MNQIILGVSFWTGHGLSLLPIHMLGGVIVVLGLWTLATLAARAGARPGLVALAIVWGLVLPLFGVTHAGILPGSLHWIIKVAHLLLGLGALRMAENLGAFVLRHAVSRTAPEPLGYGPASKA